MMWSKAKESTDLLKLKKNIYKNQTSCREQEKTRKDKDFGKNAYNFIFNKKQMRQMSETKCGTVTENLLDKRAVRTVILCGIC